MSLTALIGFIYILLIHLTFSWALFSISKDLGYSDLEKYLSFIPILNLYIFLKISNSGFINIFALCVPLLNLFVFWGMWESVSDKLKFNRKGLAIGTVIPFFNIICFLIYANYKTFNFKKSENNIIRSNEKYISYLVCGISMIISSLVLYSFHNIEINAFLNDTSNPQLTNEAIPWIFTIFFFIVILYFILTKYLYFRKQGYAILASSFNIIFGE